MDLSRLAEEMGMDEDDILDLLALFHDIATGDIRKMEDALKENNCAQARNAAHSIKGAAGNMKLVDIYELAKTAEKEALNQQIDSIPTHLQKIKEKLDVLSSYLRSV